MSPEQPAKPSYKRRQYLVDRDYQLRFVTRLFMVVLAVAATSSLLATGVLYLNMSQPGVPQQTMIYCLIAIAVTLLVELLIAIPVVWFLGIRQSHRIVGPMVRIKRVLEAIGNGEFSQYIKLRDGDALQDLAAAINAMSQSLQRRFPGPPSS